MPDFTGTPGDDVFFGTDDPESILGLGGDDFLNGGGGDDTIEGGGGDDFIQGEGGSDDLDGGGGNDTIVADSGFVSEFSPERLRGGSGADQFEFSVINPGSFINGADHIVDFEGAGARGGDVLMLVLPFSGDARLDYRGRADSSVFPGFSFTAGDGVIEVYYGPVFDNDTAIFADSNDDGEFTPDDFYLVLDGKHELKRTDFGETDFSLIGGPDGDSLVGNRFGDALIGLEGNDTLTGGKVGETIEGGAGDDSIAGGKGNDRVNGGEGADTIDGGAGRDFVAAFEGNDIVRGGAQDDTVSGGEGDDFVAGDDGDDNVDGDDGEDTLFGGAGGDDLVAGSGHDLLQGETGEDFLQGGAGRDTIFGGDQDDEIIGEQGRDVTTGGAGEDSFGFFLGDFAPSSVLNSSDIVTDFEGAGVAGGDTVDLNGERLAFAGAIDVRPRAGSALPGANDGVTQLFYTQREGDTYLIADENDDGLLDAGDFVVRFIGLHEFTIEDFEGVDFVTAGTTGDDTIVGTKEDDTIFGLAGDDSLVGRRGNDELHGGEGRDTLEGGPGGFDLLFGEGGADFISSETSDGGNADGGAGSDTLVGSADIFSFDFLNGGKGADDLYAGVSGGVLNGDSGPDRLFTGAGDDNLIGGRNAKGELDGDQDLFVYGSEPWGSDNVFDFEDGIDLFDLSASGLAFEDLTIDASSGSETVISSSLGTITINHFSDPVTITEADFIF